MLINSELALVVKIKSKATLDWFIIWLSCMVFYFTKSKTKWHYRKVRSGKVKNSFLWDFQICQPRINVQLTSA